MSFAYDMDYHNRKNIKKQKTELYVPDETVQLCLQEIKRFMGFLEKNGYVDIRKDVHTYVHMS